MSTVVLVEQRSPFIVTLASRVPTYIHIIISFLAVLLIQAVPSWTTTKPPVRVITRKRRSSSLTSNASTLVDHDESNAAKEEMNKQGKEKCHRISFSSKNPLNKLNSAVKTAISRSKAMNPTLPRRLTLPARRFSTHIVSAMHNLTPHHRRPQENSSSYFLNEEVNIDASLLDNSLVQNDMPETIASKPTMVIQCTQVDDSGHRGDVQQSESHIVVVRSGKTRSFKRTVRRATAVFGDLRLRRS
ncbi:hypothetical protein H2248_012034 [Termitomyces sp. 'cryptogamus']|nr:hypothetical protein H2248_012034 [Termitomyces sp. 'cryptogamus']